MSATITVNVRFRPWLIALVSTIGIVVVLVLSLRPRHVDGDRSATKPEARSWRADARSEYGWPFTAYRRFDRPTDVNIGGRIDATGLGADLALIILLSVGPPLFLAFTAGRRGKSLRS